MAAPGTDVASIAPVGAARETTRILLATDLTSASAAATNEALRLAAVMHADLLIVSVIDPAHEARTGWLTRSDQRREARTTAAQLLVGRWRQEGVRTSFLVWEGEPGPSIVEAAVSESVDLIVVGSHRRGQVKRALLGSVSEHVVRHAHCPVVVVPRS